MWLDRGYRTMAFATTMMLVYSAIGPDSRDIYMKNPLSSALLALTALTAFTADPAIAQTFPTRPVRIIAGSPGGGNDMLARLLAPTLTTSLKQQVIVENKPSGVIPFDTVAKAEPNGYTVLVAGNDFWIGPLVQNTPYDPVRDFEPVILAASAPNVMVVPPSLPANDVKQFIALAKSEKGGLRYASSARGGVSHLAAELFKSMAGVEILHVPYKGTGPALTGLISNEVQLMFPNLAGAMPQIKSGRLKALAVTSAKPTQLFPELPTVAASGLPGYQSVTVYGFFVPRTTPAAIVQLLNQELGRALTRPDVKERLQAAGLEAVAGTGDEMGAFLKAEIVTLGRVIKENGIRAD